MGFFAAFVVVFVAALIVIPVGVLAAEGVVGWVLAGPRVLPVEYKGPEVVVLDPYRYQSREQVQAYHDRNYRRWEKRRAFWRRLRRRFGLK